MSKKVIAKSNKSGQEKEVEAVPFAPFPAYVLFYRSKEQEEMKYGVNDKTYNSSFLYDTYIPVLMGADTGLLGCYCSNNNIPTLFYAKKRKNEPISEEEKDFFSTASATSNNYSKLTLYPRKRELPNAKDIKNERKNYIARLQKELEKLQEEQRQNSLPSRQIEIQEIQRTLQAQQTTQEVHDELVEQGRSVLPNAYYPAYKVPMLHIPIGVESITLRVTVYMPKKENCNLAYESYKKFRDEKEETIHFAIVENNEGGAVGLEQDDIHYLRAERTGLALGTTSISHKIKDDEKAYDLTINVDQVSVPTARNCSIIAYYVNTNSERDNGKEMIIGQLNVLRSSYHKYNEYHNASSEDVREIIRRFSLNLNPSTNQVVLDINFVRVLSTVTDTFPKTLPHADVLLESINKGVKQLGIRFRRRGNPQTNGYEDIVVTDNDFRALGRNVREFIIADGVRNIYDDKITHWVSKDVKKIFGGNNTCVRYFQGVMPYSTLQNQLRNKRINAIRNSREYQSFIGNHPFLDRNSRNVNLNVLEDIETRIFEYFHNRMFTIYIFNSIDTEELVTKNFYQYAPNGHQYIESFTLGTAVTAQNNVTVYKAAFTSIQETIIHEIGHCLSLNHTFEREAVLMKPIIPYKFEADRPLLWKGVPFARSVTNGLNACIPPDIISYRKPETGSEDEIKRSRYYKLLNDICKLYDTAYPLRGE